MADKKWLTDEDRMIDSYKAHRDLITWIMNKLQAEGIDCRRTTSNDSHGDILYYKHEDAPRVKEIIREINSKYNP